MQNQSMQEKINLYCDLNEIPNQELYYPVLPFLDNSHLQHCIARNTNDFLIYGIRDLAHGHIDDETFFQIGDITSTRPLKQTRPHLDAVEKVLENVQDNTLYVIDHAAKIAYTHVHGSREKVEQVLKEKNSMIVEL